MNIKNFLKNLTTQPGVYQMLGENSKILYIGKARNLKKRLASYFSKKQQDTKTFALLKHVKDINVTITHNENEALLLECNLIKKHKPHYNVLFRDDKSYPYIFISEDHPYPCIDLYRGPRKSSGNYFGPYPNTSSVRETIHLIQKIFGIRSCSDRYSPSRTRPCLRYQMGLCSGSCAGLISVADYQRDIQHAILFLQGKNQEILVELNKQMDQAASQLHYELAAKLRNQIASLRDIQARQYVSSSHGDVDVLGFAMDDMACIQLLIIRGGIILGSRAFFPTVPHNSTPEEIISSFIAQHYSLNQELPKEIILGVSLPDAVLLKNALSIQAGHKVSLAMNVRGERKKWLDIATASAKQSVASYTVKKANIKERFLALQQALHLKDMPKRIECFDISHTLGEATVASCVVFDKTGAVKSDYRRFNITGITPGDDVAAMHQVLVRRYQRLQAEKSKLPDIILIDGGTTQLAAASAMLSELNIHEVDLVGVAKGVTRKPGLETIHRPEQTPLHLPADSLALHLIQQIRDEAHRFAITGHRMRRDKARGTSSLEKIPGIGAKRRRELLRYFGGIQALNRASLAEIAKVPGISESLANRIFAALHKTV